MKKNKASITVNGIIIARDLLKKRFAPCDLAECKHACCRYGAVVGTERIKKITRLLPKLFPLMRPEAVETVKRKGFHLSTLFKRSDMSPDHDHHYMRTVKGRCVFLSFDDKGGCVLQRYGAAHHMSYKLKPEGCWGFPYDLVGNKLVVYNWKNLPCLNASKNKNAPLMHMTCKQELIDFLGKDGYNTLLHITNKEERGL